MLLAPDVVSLCSLFDQHGIRFWVMGGWGADALLRRETRPHKDLDILVARADLPTLWRAMTERGFALKYVWEENRWLGEEPERWPTAFVLADTQGRELDAHVIDFDADGAIIQLYANPWPLPDELRGQGSIAGVTVNCVSREAQIAMHTGYDLPAAQARDLHLLQTN